MRATHVDQRAAVRAAEQVAWQRLHAAVVWRSGIATYRAALHAWRTARYDLDRALVPVPPVRA